MTKRPMTKTPMTKMKLTLSVMTCAAFLSACASTGAGHEPIVDAPKTPQYYADLDQCRALAEQREIFNGETQTAAAIGALGGAAIGALGHRSDGDDVLNGAVIGGLLGGGSGVLAAKDEQKHILLSCLAGRGYRVLG